MLTRATSERSRTVAAARRGVSLVLVLVVLIIVVVVGYGLMKLVGGLGDSADAADSNMATHSVKRENLLISVTEDGNLESASNIDVKCEIPGGSTILWIVPDGTEVKAGDKIIELDSATIDEQLEAQKGVYEKALAAKIKATEDAGAAEIAVREYAEGTYVKDLQLAEANITLAMEDLRSAQNVLGHTKRMARKGFTTPLQVEADQFAVKRAELQLATYQTEKKVLEQFTREKTLKALEATRDAAQAAARSELANMNLEKAKLDRLTSYLSKCVITAPQDGMLVYYKERSRWGSSNSQIEEGAPVRERQVIAQIPNLAEMQAIVPIHESKVDQITVDPSDPQRCFLKVLENEFQGSVVSVANQPESKSFFQAAVKEYPTIVRIDGDASSLRPGMTAEVEILIADLKDVLTVPVSAVIENRGNYRCWVQTAEGLVRRDLKLGLTNDKMVQVIDGVAEGEKVVLNPRRLAQESTPLDGDGEADEEEVDTAKKFGKGKPGAAPKKEPSGGANGSRKRKTFADLDQNGDGKLTQDELPSQWGSEAFKRMDEDGDGSVSKSEHAKASAAFRRQQQQSGGGGVRQGGGPPR